MSLRELAVIKNPLLAATGGRLGRFLQNSRISGVLKFSTAMETSNGFVGDGKSIVAISQMRSTADKAANLDSVNTLVQLAKEKNAKFLFLPECCDFVGENRNQTLKLSEPLTGPTVQAYQKLAKDNKLWMSFGGIHESICNQDGSASGKINNAHVVINDNGEIVAVYRKLHLFDVVTPNFRFRESEVVAPGKQIIAPIRTPIGSLGLQICYDVRFAEVSTLLRKAGAEILTYPSAFAQATGKAHWEVLMRARAIENQCYVIAAAQKGFHNAKRESYGHAMIVNAWGEIIATCAENELHVATAEIILSAAHKVRVNMPCFEHRRNEVYSLTPLAFSDSADGVQDKGNRMFAEHTIPKETIFYESQYCYAFTNLRCVVKGHILVATKRIAPRLKDLTTDEVTDLFQSVCKIQKVLESIYNTSAATVTVQDGEQAGQTVKHVHFHVMPRRKGDFEHNDEIYVKLQKLERCEVTKNRTLSEMSEEADLYRRYFEKML